MSGLAGIELPSNRKFGLFTAAIFAALATWLTVSGEPRGGLLPGVAALVLALLAAVKPTLLEPLNKAWMRLGLALGAIVNPIVLGLLFFVLFTPLALALRLVGRDELRLRRAPPGESYWRVRSPRGPDAASFARQF